MKALCKNLQLAGIDVALPAVVAIDGRQADTSKRMNVIVGFASSEADNIVPTLVGQWLSRLCHRHFVENGRGAAGDLAAEAFYDKLAWNFPGDTPFVAALITRPRPARLANCDIVPGLIGGAELARWRFRGQVRAYLNPAAGIAQVTFDELPGGIALVSKNGFAPSVSRAFERCHEVGAWYGFGVPVYDPAKAVMTLRDEFADPRRTRIAARAPAHV